MFMLQRPVPSRWVLRAAALPIALAALVAHRTPAAADIEVVMTADNAYSFGWGPETGIPGVAGTTAEYYGPVVNTASAQAFAGCPAASAPIPLSSKAVPGNPSGVERFVVPSADIAADQWFYVAAWSDNANWQGLLGALRNTDDGTLALTGHPDWEVCATGEDFGASSTDNPTLATLNDWIVRCNRATSGGLGADTSGGWVTETKDFGQGRLYVDHAATNADAAHAQGKPYGPIGCLNGAARWMWFNADPDPALNPLINPPSVPAGAEEHKEFLIFRLPARTVVQDPACMTLQPLRVECQPGPLGPSGCYRVQFRLTNDTSNMAHFVSVSPLGGGTVSPGVIQLLVPIGLGQQANREFVWCPPPGTSPTSAAFSLSLLDATASGCCARRLTVELPPCLPTSECFQIPEFRAECVPGGPPGAVKVTLWVAKGHAEPRTVHLIAPAPVAVSPQPHHLGAVAGTFGPIEYTVTGAAADANPRTICFWVNLQPPTSALEPYDLTGPCCSERVCIQVPFCGLPTPTPNPVPAAAVDVATGGASARQP